MSEELERYKKALEQLADYGHGCGCHPVCRCEEASNLIILRDEMRSIAHEALHPPPEVEEVEVVRWLCPICETTYGEIGTARCCDPDADLIKLTGTIKRPVKRKVVSEVVRENVSITDQGEIYGNATFWKHAECHGKTVTLIARWTE